MGVTLEWFISNSLFRIANEACVAGARLFVSRVISVGDVPLWRFKNVFMKRHTRRIPLHHHVLSNPDAEIFFVKTLGNKVFIVNMKSS